MPDVVNGYTQHPIEGVSFAGTFDDADAPTPKTTQFYSMLGTRAIWHDGWKAATAVPAAPESWGDFAPAALGAVRHDRGSDRVPRPRRGRAGQAPGADRAVVGRGGALPGAPARVAWCDRDPRARSGPSCRGRARATSTAPAAPRSPSRSRRTSATARTRSPPSWTSRRPRPAGCCSRRARASAATRCTIRDGKLVYVYNFIGERVQEVESDGGGADGPRRRVGLVRA